MIRGAAGLNRTVPQACELWECSGLTELWNAARPLSLESAMTSVRVNRQGGWAAIQNSGSPSFVLKVV